MISPTIGWRGTPRPAWNQVKRKNFKACHALNHSSPLQPTPFCHPTQRPTSPSACSQILPGSSPRISTSILARDVTRAGSFLSPSDLPSFRAPLNISIQSRVLRWRWRRGDICTYCTPGPRRALLGLPRASGAEQCRKWNWLGINWNCE